MFDGGTGVANDPYLISTRDQIAEMASYAGAYFALAADVDMGSTHWAPITVSGVLDGMGHRIMNFRSVPASGVGGLFGGHNGPLTVKRLGIEGDGAGVVTGSGAYGAYLLAVQITYDVLIEDCFITGPVDHGLDRGSGFVGLTQSATTTIRRCWCDTHIVRPGRGSPIAYQFGGVLDATDSFFRQILSNTTNTPGAPLYSKDVVDQSKFTNFDFTNTWQMTSNGPRLRPMGTKSVSGVITDDTGAPCARVVRVLNRATGELLASTTSDPATGAYILSVPSGAEVQRIVLDDDAGTLYNDIIDRVIPA